MYLNDIALAWLSPGQREFLVQLITGEEIGNAIRLLVNGKTAGSDGLPGEFCRMYSDPLVPHLMGMYQEAYETHSLPPTMRDALLITLLKLDKAPKRCDSYCLLSLINTDVKILAKILAIRLQPLLLSLVLLDQSGFIPSRSTTHNFHTLFTILHQLDPSLPAAAVFLNATKAFDSIQWPYMFRVLARTQAFLHWIYLLYEGPVARIRVNGITSDPLRIHRGTRQACPLSPILFTLALEPLVCIIRQRHSAAAMRFRQCSLAISLHANHMVVHARDPTANLASTVQEYVKY